MLNGRKGIRSRKPSRARLKAMKRQIELHGPPSRSSEIMDLEFEDIEMKPEKKKREDKPWVQEDIDKVLNILLSEKIDTNNFEMICKRVGQQFGRTTKSITTLLWKLATRYKEHANYMPGQLRMRRRIREPFSWMDEYICRTAWNKKDIKVQMHIAGILMRPAAQIIDWYEKRESKGRTKLGVFR